MPCPPAFKEAAFLFSMILSISYVLLPSQENNGMELFIANDIFST